MNAASASQGLYRNWVSYCGGLLASAGAGLFLLSLLMHFSVKSPGPYFGIFTFVLFPGIVIAGLVVIGLGGLLESRRRRRSGATAASLYPALDLNDPRQRTRFEIAFGVGIVLAIGFSFAGYNGFLLTES